MLWLHWYNQNSNRESIPNQQWSKGVVGEFILDKSITVTAGRTTNLGEIVFTEKRVGPVAWEIGIPDRTAKEFKHGDHFNQWGLPYKFPKEFPNSIN